MSRTFKDRPKRLRDDSLQFDCPEKNCVFCSPRFNQKNRKTRERIALQLELQQLLEESK